MLSELFIRNIDDKLFEIQNNRKYFLEIDGCSLILNRDKTSELKNPCEAEKQKFLIQTFKSNEDAVKIKEYMFEKLKDKADLKLAIQNFKKIKGLSDNFIEEYKRKLRNEYFEFKISDICNELNIQI